MKLTKTEIVEYLVALAGVITLLAHIQATTEGYQSVADAQALPMIIEAGWTIHGDVGNSAVRFREIALEDARR